MLYTAFRGFKGMATHYSLSFYSLILFYSFSILPVHLRFDLKIHFNFCLFRSHLLTHSTFICFQFDLLLTFLV